jgi:hypothetical protein
MNERAQHKLDVEKWIWTDADFPKMGWHDVRIHGIAPYEKIERNEETGEEGHFDDPELLLDIDYILKWPKLDSTIPPKEGWLFWVSPATLAFERVADFEVRWSSHRLDWEIHDIEREQNQYSNGDKCWKWEISGTGITFLSSGYEQYIRQEPVPKKFQSLTLEERGGVSFSKRAVNSN